MFRRLRYLWAFLAAAAAAVLLRGLAAALPCPATEVLSPINESPWELGKLVFWPYLTAALLLWRLEPLESASRRSVRHSADGAIVPLSVGRPAPVAAVLRRGGRSDGAVPFSAAAALTGWRAAVVSAGHPVGGCLSAVDGAAPDRRYFPRPP